MVDFPFYNFDLIISVPYEQRRPVTLGAVVCQSSTGNGKSMKQREREQRAGWFSEETTGQLSYTTLFNPVLLTDETAQKT